MKVRRIEPDEAEVIALVAERMRATLVEVLGETRGDAMFTPRWLEERLRFHLEPGRAAWVAEAGGEVAGHCFARLEASGEARIGTIYVVPEARRAGVASALLEVAEAWATERGAKQISTLTADDNRRLHRLFEGRRYRLEPVDVPEMVRLRRRL